MAASTITAAGMRVVKLLVGHPPRSVAELIEETGVTRTAVTEQLNEMVAAGFVEQSIEPACGRGRPRHLFAATKAALVLLFANNQQLVVPAMWKAVHDAGGEKLTRKILRAVGRRLAQHYAARITETSPKKRIEQFLAVMEEEGGLVDMTRKDGHLTLVKRTCAFISMADSQEHVCGIDMALLSAVAGCPVRRTACRHEGSPCCEFEFTTRAAKRSATVRTDAARK
jgi:predicted ArsR family transcriptional regulator